MDELIFRKQQQVVQTLGAPQRRAALQDNRPVSLLQAKSNSHHPAPIQPKKNEMPANARTSAEQEVLRTGENAASVQSMHGIVQRVHAYAYYVVTINGTQYYRARVRGHPAQQAVVQAALAASGASAAQITGQRSQARAPLNGTAV